MCPTYYSTFKVGKYYGFFANAFFNLGLEVYQSVGVSLKKITRYLGFLQTK